MFALWMPTNVARNHKGRKTSAKLKQNIVMKRILLLSALAFVIATTSAQTGFWGLIQLPYASEALEPVISRRTIELHHGKHLAGYVETLNLLVKDTEYEGKSLEHIVRHSSGVIFNNAGQVLNHILYFQQFSPQGGGVPTGRLARAIEEQWGTFDDFREEFEKRGAALFGSGWVWLAQTADGTLIILQEPGGSNPVASGCRPILGFDVWEHAYYLDYENRRLEHLRSLWDIIDWQVVGERYARP